MERQHRAGREMTARANRSGPGAAGLTLRLLGELLERYSPRDFAVRLWDGTTWAAQTVEPRFTLSLEHPGALRRMLLPPSELSLGEAFINGDVDIDGPLDAALGLAQYLIGRRLGPLDRARLTAGLLRLPTRAPVRTGSRAARLSGFRHSKSRDRQAVRYHYDVGNDFFALFLGRAMVYSCAYFAHEADDIDAAQAHKLDYICRKLRLRPGRRLLDIGCGWGALVIHAARRYGVEATGITLSQPQAEWARERIREAGLTGRCRVEVGDYREWREEGGFDNLVSVGMFEHVGQSRLPEYFGRAWRLLRPGGVMLNHGIARRLVPANRRRPAPGSFTQRYVFPDGELLPLSTTLRIAEERGFEVRDVESLREHYALTLRCWLRALEANGQAARRLVDEVTYRIWRLFVAMSIGGFERGDSNLYQALLVKPDHGRSGLPLRRDDWYAPREARGRADSPA